MTRDLKRDSSKRDSSKRDSRQVDSKAYKITQKEEITKEIKEADIADTLENRYCSWCLNKRDHQLIEAHRLRRSIYQCAECGNYTVQCRFCDNMAKGADKKSFGKLFSWDNERCAEHDGSIIRFAPINPPLKNITEYERLLTLGSKSYSFGSTIGKHLLSEYFTDDERFDIIQLSKSSQSTSHNKSTEKAAESQNKPHRAIVINGFLKERDKIFEDWCRAFELIPDNIEIYGLTWASKNFEDFTRSLLSPKLGNIFSKKLFLAQLAYSAITNPWHVSMKKAADTGELLGNILYQSEEGPYSLIAHSLGCRVIFYTLELLKYHPEIKINNVILLGGAVDNNPQEWEALTTAISGKIYNCHSDHDATLHTTYAIANAKLSKPIGYYPIESDGKRIINIDCSDIIEAHTEWKDRYPEVYQRILREIGANSLS